MKRFLPVLMVVTALQLVFSTSSSADEQLRPVLENVYGEWRQAMISKNFNRWTKTISTERQIEIRNRVLSERRAWPSAVFELPVAPPSLSGLKPARLNVRGPTAKSIYYGKVDFGVGGAPSDNILVLSFVKEDGWLYESAEFINLLALADVRTAFDKGDFSELDKQEFQPSGNYPSAPPVQLKGPVAAIAKVYCYCPGRKVTAQVNRKSRHEFANEKLAEVVIGGAHSGDNQIEFKVEKLAGGTGKEPLALRVYVMSEKPGVRIPAVYEYLVEEGGSPQVRGSDTFTVSPEVMQKIR